MLHARNTSLVSLKDMEVAGSVIPSFSECVILSILETKIIQYRSPAASGWVCQRDKWQAKSVCRLDRLYFSSAEFPPDKEFLHYISWEVFNLIISSRSGDQIVSTQCLLLVPPLVLEQIEWGPSDYTGRSDQLHFLISHIRKLFLDLELDSDCGLSRDRRDVFLCELWLL